MIGKIYGSLTVIRFNGTTERVTVRCECGQFESHKLYMLTSGKVRKCAKCRDRERYLKSIQIDPQLLIELEPAIAARVLQNYRQHLEVCQRQRVRASSFVTFVSEAIQDPDLMSSVEEDQSFEARYQRSNPQSYHQYHRPALKEMI